MSESTNDKNYDEFDISDKWKNKFTILEKVEGKIFPIFEKQGQKTPSKVLFNILGFLFGYFYYFSKKMHYKGAFILGASTIYSIFIILIVGIEFNYMVYSLPVMVITALIANYDYFKFVTKKEIMWDGFPEIFSNIKGAIGFPLIALILYWSLLFGVFSNFSVPSCSDTITTNLVKQIADREMTRVLGAEQAKRVSYIVNAIRTKSTDEQTGFHKCSANLSMTHNNTQKKSKIPITYTVEKTDDGKEIYVNVFGL